MFRGLLITLSLLKNCLCVIHFTYYTYIPRYHRLTRRERHLFLHQTFPRGWISGKYTVNSVNLKHVENDCHVCFMSGYVTFAS